MGICCLWAKPARIPRLLACVIFYVRYVQGQPSVCVCVGGEVGIVKVNSEPKPCELLLPVARKLIMVLGHEMEVTFMDGKLFTSFTSRDVYFSDAYAQKGIFC